MDDNVESNLNLYNFDGQFHVDSMIVGYLDDFIDGKHGKSNEIFHFLLIDLKSLG